MSEEVVYFEMKTLLSKNICKESIFMIYKVTKTKSRLWDIIFASIMFIAFIFELFLYVMNQDISTLWMIFVPLLGSLYMLFLYFKGYSLPKSLYQKRLVKMSIPSERQYKFYAESFEEILDQSTQRIFYNQIKLIIDFPQAIILLTDNKQFLLNRDNIPKNGSDFLHFLQSVTKAKYTKLNRK